MYIDLSLKKIVPLLAIAAAMFVSLAGTFALKQARFGSTPFYAAVSLGWQQATGYALYPIERAMRAFASDLFAAGSGPAYRAGQAAGIPVITYHRLVNEPDGANVTFDNFREQMEMLKDAGWQTLTLAEYEAFMRGEASLPSRSILVTFDDGAKQSYYPVDPILKTLGFNAVNYIIVGDSERDETTYYLSPEEIANMLETGRWEIGSHSYAGHHPYIIDSAGTEGHFFSDKLWLPDEQRLETEEEFRKRVLSDLRDSRDRLSSVYGVAINGFAFPFGDTGETSVNYPGSHAAVVAAAEEIYDYAWVQPGAGEFTFNYPHEEEFLMRRIRVSPDWSGADLLRELEKGMGKPIPYEEDFALDRGWLRTWGRADVEPGALRVAAEADTTGGSVFLDGTGGWRDYEAAYRGSWQSGYVTLLAGLRHSSRYYDCSFGAGEVRIRSINGAERELLARAEHASIVPGESAHLAIRVQGSRIQCVYDGTTVLQAWAVSDIVGGIGLQVWNETPGAARFEATALTVKDISAERLPAPVAATAISPGEASAHQTPSVPNTGTTVSSPAPNSSQPASVSTGPVVHAQSGSSEDAREDEPRGEEKDKSRDRVRERRDSLYDAVRDIMNTRPLWRDRRADIERDQ